MGREDTIRDMLGGLGKLDDEKAAEFESGDLVTYLQERQLQVSPVAQEMYAGWSQEFKARVNQQLLAYARLQPDLEEERKTLNLEYLDRFLSLRTCQDDQAPDDDLAAVEEAFRAMAQELRDFYGREDYDDEVPCWSRGR